MDGPMMVAYMHYHKNFKTLSSINAQQIWPFIAKNMMRRGHYIGAEVWMSKENYVIIKTTFKLREYRSRKYISCFPGNIQSNLNKFMDEIELQVRIAFSLKYNIYLEKYLSF